MILGLLEKSIRYPATENTAITKATTALEWFYDLSVIFFFRFDYELEKKPRYIVFNSILSCHVSQRTTFQPIGESKCVIVELHLLIDLLRL